MDSDSEESIALSCQGGCETTMLSDLELAIRLSLRSACAVCFLPFSAKISQAQHSCALHVGELCGMCLRQHIAAQGPVPRCPMPGCTHELTEKDMRQFGDDNALQSWQQALLARALPTLGRVITCPQSACGARVIFDGEGRNAVTCPECSYKFCSDCKMPYHYCVECNFVQTFRSRYMRWVVHGRAAYHGAVSHMRKRALKQEAALAHARQRYEELCKDEEWKAKNCRMCECGRVVQRLSGCSVMRCGYDVDTKGNQQDGCGRRFDWEAARPYIACLGSPPESKPLPTDLAHYHAKASGSHGHWRCDVCNSPIKGLRFRCIHCPAFNCCTECEKNISDTHQLDHVFEILEPPTRSEDGSLEYSIDECNASSVASSSSHGSLRTPLRVSVNRARVFMSCTSSNLLWRARKGERVIQSGPVQRVDGYDMLPLHPQGAIESRFVVPDNQRKRHRDLSVSSSGSSPQKRRRNAYGCPLD